MRHVIIVLGSAVLRSGAPSPAIRRRVRAGVALHRSLEDSVLIMSGGIGRFGPSEAGVMAALAVADGVAEDRILLEEMSLNTRENIRNSTSLIPGHEDVDLHIVTDGYHVPRCRMYLALSGRRARCHGAPGAFREEPAGRIGVYLLREAAGLVKYAWAGLADRFA